MLLSNRLAADLEAVFFRDYGEQIDHKSESKTVIFESGVEVVDSMGALVVVSFAVTCKVDELQKRDKFTRLKDGRVWMVGDLLERSPDNLVNTFEIVASD